jgi:hypothetical protein
VAAGVDGSSCVRGFFDGTCLWACRALLPATLTAAACPPAEDEVGQAAVSDTDLLRLVPSFGLLAGHGVQVRGFDNTQAAAGTVPQRSIGGSGKLSVGGHGDRRCTGSLPLGPLCPRRCAGGGAWGAATHGRQEAPPLCSGCPSCRGRSAHRRLGSSHRTVLG